MSITIRINHGYTDYEIEQDERGKLIEPTCSQCSVGVIRPKCMLELGGYCPRHDLADAYKEALRQSTKNHDFEAYGYDTRLASGPRRNDPRCSLCMKPRSEHETEAQAEQ